MNWLDFLLALGIVGLAVLQMVRGFGRAVWDVLAVYGALWLAGMASLPLSQAVRFHEGAAINHACAFGLLFVVFGVAAVTVSHFVYGMTLINAGMFEGLLGMAAGVALGMVVAHALVASLVMADPRGQAGALLVAQSSVGDEMLSFHTYHACLDTLSGAGASRRELPNVAGR